MNHTETLLAEENTRNNFMSDQTNDFAIECKTSHKYKQSFDTESVLQTINELKNKNKNIIIDI